MTYIELCKRLRQEVGASGADVTVSGATGEWKRLCDWIAEAYNEIQRDNLGKWHWLRTTKTFTTTASQSEYDYASAPLSLTDFASWRDNSFRLYKNIGDEFFLDQWNYSDFRDYYIIGNNRTTEARPQSITISPTKSLILGLVPDDAYTVVTEYYKSPESLASDSDEPDMPSRFHMAIVYKAMTYYALYENASEHLVRGENLFDQIYAELMADQLDQVRVHRSFL